MKVPAYRENLSIGRAFVQLNVRYVHMGMLPVVTFMVDSKHDRVHSGRARDPIRADLKTLDADRGQE